MSKITIYQKPTCTKCRIAIKTLTSSGKNFDSINYYEKPLTASKLKTLHQKMGKSPWETIRSKEQIYKDLKLAKRKNEISEDELFKIMVKYPDLIQRPIIEIGDKAYLARDETILQEIISKL